MGSDDCAGKLVEKQCDRFNFAVHRAERVEVYCRIARSGDTLIQWSD